MRWPVHDPLLGGHEGKHPLCICSELIKKRRCITKTQDPPITDRWPLVRDGREDIEPDRSSKLLGIEIPEVDDI